MAIGLLSLKTKKEFVSKSCLKVFANSLPLILRIVCLQMKNLKYDRVLINHLECCLEMFFNITVEVKVGRQQHRKSLAISNDNGDDEDEIYVLLNKIVPQMSNLIPRSLKKDESFLADLFYFVLVAS